MIETVHNMGQVLVVAKDHELRSSLQFALEAEGHMVETVSRLDATLGAERRYDCVIVDHHATDRRPRETVTRLFRRLGPVVLLANASNHPLSPESFRTVLKPLLGPALSQAVAQAMAGETPA